MQGGGYGYEMPGAQTWNPGAFGGGNNFPPFGATGRMKSTSRGRPALPSVSEILSPKTRGCMRETNAAVSRPGLISNRPCLP